MPCRWFLIFDEIAGDGHNAATANALTGFSLKSRVPKAIVDDVAAFPACCDAGTRFVHLSFRVKSAFVRLT
jgi:hypothetical protein